MNTGEPKARRHSPGWPWACVAAGWLFLSAAALGQDAPPAGAFERGLAAYAAGQFAGAAREFQAAATNPPAAGTFLNLGLTEWRRGRTGAALNAWEQVLWVSPHNPAAQNGLRYARRLMDVESPALRWYERVSTWLPINAWAWATTMGAWMTLGALLLPDILRRRRTGLTQALAALGLVVLLLSLPAQYGVFTRQQLGFVLQRSTPLRLTPTQDSEITARLPAGEPIRELREHGGYVLVKTAQGEGWLERAHYGLIVPH